MREKTASGKNFKAALVYDKDGIKITTYQRVTGFPDYCISGKGIIVCTKNNPLHYSGEVIDYTKKCSVKLYTSITNEIIDVDLVWLLAVQFIGFDTTGTMRPELNSPDGTIKIEYVTYHWNNLKQLDEDHIDIDGIIYTRFDKSIYTYLSKDGIAFNLRRKEFQRATMEPKGYSMIGYNKRFRKAGEKATGAVRSHLAMWDIYHPEDPRGTYVDEDGHEYKDQIDHINGDKSRNQLDNLRKVTGIENIRASKDKQGLRENLGWSYEDAELIAFMMACDFGFKDIVAFDRKYHVFDPNRSYTTDDVRALTNAYRRRLYWKSFVDKYNLEGHPVYPYAYYPIVTQKTPDILAKYQELHMNKVAKAV